MAMRLTLAVAALGFGVGCSQAGHPASSPCPAGMTPVEGGILSSATTVAPYCLDTTEVTVASYAACARSGACTAAPETTYWVDISDADRDRWSPACNGERRDRRDHPVNCVDWAQADTYCRAQGKRLPSAEEWEWAARGGSRGWVHPWGPAPAASQICWSGVTKREGTCPVGSLPEGDTPAGIHDLAGNVWEFTSTTGHVAMGAGYNVDNASLVDVTVRIPGEAAFRGPNTGFRCAR